MRGRFLELFLLGMGIFLLMFYLAGPIDVVRNMLKINARYLALFFLIQVVIMVVWAVKWRIVLRHTDVPLRKIIHISFVGTFVNNMAPMAMAGGEPTRAYILSKTENVPTEKSVASVVIDLFLEIVAMLVILFVTVVLSFRYEIPYRITMILALAGLIVFGLFFVVILLLTNRKFALSIINAAFWICERVPILSGYVPNARSRANEILKNFQNAMKETMMDRYVITCGTLASLVNWFVTIIRMYLIFGVIGIYVSLPTLLFVRLGMTIIGYLFMIPVPGAMGIWEGSGMWLFGFFGVSAASALAAVSIERLFSFWISSFIGILSAIHLGLNYKQLATRKK